MFCFLKYRLSHPFRKAEISRKTLRARYSGDFLKFQREVEEKLNHLIENPNEPRILEVEDSIAFRRSPLGRMEELSDDFMKQRVQPTLQAQDHGKFVALDVNTGEFEIDEDDYTAVARLRLRKPNADMWLARAGFPTTCRIGVVR